MSAAAKSRLIFVYAGDSGAVTAMLHYLHKIVRPETYPCSLCAVTYGPLGERRAWREFIAQIDPTPEFLHRDEFAKRYPTARFDLPAVVVDAGTTVEVLIPASEIDGCTDLDALITLVRGKLRVGATGARLTPVLNG